jgi:hypothetical protein
MENVYRLKYPLFYTIIFVLGFIVATGIALMLIITNIGKGSILSDLSLWDTISGLLIGLSLTSFLFIFGILCFLRLKYSFTKVYIDKKEESISYYQFNKFKKIRFKDIIKINDYPNKGVIKIYDRTSNLTIPKELNNYMYFYNILWTKDLINDNIDFLNFKTSIGGLYYILLIPLLGFGIFPILMIPDLIRDFDGSSNSITGLILLPLASLMIFTLILIFAKKYNFKKDKLIISSPIFKRTIKYTDIENIDYDPYQRSIKLYLNREKTWLEKLNGQNGIDIREPGNISIERIFFELEKIKTTYNKV